MPDVRAACSAMLADPNVPGQPEQQGTASGTLGKWACISERGRAVPVLGLGLSAGSAPTPLDYKV